MENKKTYFVREMNLLNARFGWDKFGNYQLILELTDGTEKYKAFFWFDNKTFGLFGKFLLVNKINFDFSEPDPLNLGLLLQEIRSREKVLVTDKIYPVKF